MGKKEQIRRLRNEIQELRAGELYVHDRITDVAKRVRRIEGAFKAFEADSTSTERKGKDSGD